MSQRKPSAASTEGAVRKTAGRKRGEPATPAQKAAGQANLSKGRAARVKLLEKMRADEAAGKHRQTAGERWAMLLDGSLAVDDLDNDELARMQVRSKDGSFAGRPRAVPSHLAQAMQKEAIKRATDMFRSAAPRAVKRLLDIAEDPDTADRDALRALDIVLNRGLGKQPETVLIERETAWDDVARDSSMSGVDRELKDMASE